MQSSLQLSTKTILFFIVFSFFSASLLGQNQRFIGTELLKEGNKVALKTTPQINSINQPISNQPNSVTLPGDRYVLDGNIIWAFADGLAINTTSRLDDSGNTPINAWTLNNMRISRYPETSSTPLWEFPTAPDGATVEVSGNGEIVAVCKAQQFYLLDKTTGAINYQLTLPDTFWASSAAISKDGQKAVFVAEAYAGSNTARAYGLNISGTPTVDWTYDVPANLITNWAGVSISSLGNKTVLMGRNYFYVVNTSTGALIWDHFMDNTESAPGISNDGNVIATANNSGFVQAWLYNSTTSQYDMLWAYRVPAGAFTNWGSSVGISGDGNTIAAGTLIFNASTYDGSVIAFNTYSGGVPKWIYMGTGDLVDEIAISDDGKVVAAATWGDLAHLKPDLYVFDGVTGDTAFTVTTPGSFHTVDISSDGSKVIAGGKATHAREFGNGGRIYYCQISLGGGNVSGTVNLPGLNDSGVLVKVVGTPRSAVTALNGSYTISNIPAGTYTISAEKPGYNYGTLPNIVVTNGSTTNGVNFVLAAFPGTAPVLSASTSLMNKIELTWPVMMTPERIKEIARIVGDNYDPALQDVVSRSAQNQYSDETLITDQLADSIAVYRSFVQGGPYSKIASVPATSNTYTDSAVFPLRQYFYIINKFNEIGQTVYSNEAIGEVNDSLLTFDITVPLAASVPTIDGVISPGEWTDAFKVDISDVLGNGSGTPKAQGSVFLYLKFSQDNKLLYIAGEDFLNPTLDDNEGFGFYLDDNNNNMFESTTALPVYQEGNFWAYWHPSGALVRFRPLYTGGGAGVVDTLEQLPVAFSAGSGHLQGEFVIPIGFEEGYQLQVYSPDRTVGLGAFLIRRESGAAIFNGWWPQTMFSLFNPQYFGDVNIDIDLSAPPQAPGNIVVAQQGNDLLLTWDDPTLGLNNDPLPVPPVINIYKNGEFFTTLNAGVESLVDDNVECTRWYEYQFEAFIVVGGDTMMSPRSPIVGQFACQTPTLTAIKYDDGSWESFYVVSFTFDENKFALRFTPTFYPARVMRLETTVNTKETFDFTIHADNGGLPGDIIAGPFRVGSTSPLQVSTISLTLPGNEPPIIDNGDFWAVINYLPATPGGPGIGVDVTPPNSGRGKFFTRTDDWQDFAGGNLMITAYIADLPPIGVDDGNTVPATFELMQNYPNPFNPSTVIGYQLPETEHVLIEVYNALGQKVRTLVDDVKDAGRYSISWDGNNNSGQSVSSGIYLYKINTGKYSNTKKMMLLR